MKRARRILVQSPTGSGKTHIIATLVAAAVKSNLSVLVLATRTKLVSQLHGRLCEFGVNHGVLAAELPHLGDRFQSVQVASVDTLHRRCIEMRKIELPPADVVIFDEAHLAAAATRQRILNAYPNAWRFGFTATPALTSGRSLRDQYDELVLGPTKQELIAKGALVPARIFNKPVMSKDELQKIPKLAGEYQGSAASKLMSRPKLIGDAVQNWLTIANGERTLLFACDKKHGALLAQEFSKAGIAAEQITDEDEELERGKMIERLESGKTNVLINCFLLSYGVDIPSVECIQLARPTRSLILYLQAVGRAERPFPGKTSYKLIDHGRIVETLGLPTDPFDWTLDEVNVNELTIKAVDKRKQGQEKAVTCPECDCMWMVSESSASCPECGWKAPKRILPVQVVDAQLVEITPTKEDILIQDFYCQALYFYKRRWPDKAREKPNSARGWCWMRTKERFKLPPIQAMPDKFWHLRSLPMTPEVEGWLKYALIKYYKSKRRGDNSGSWRSKNPTGILM